MAFFIHNLLQQSEITNEHSSLARGSLDGTESCENEPLMSCVNPQGTTCPSSVISTLSSPQWYQSMNYISLATRQDNNYQINSTNNEQYPAIIGWDSRLPWLQSYIQKSQHKRKGGQIRFTNEQTDKLEQKFDSHKYLSSQERKKLAKSLQLSERQVKTWFQNRRAKWRRIRKDEEDEIRPDTTIHQLPQLVHCDYHHYGLSHKAHL